MKSIADQLTNYANYHRDRRNIATHFVGIPMIVLGVTALLARPTLVIGGVGLSPIMVVTTLAVIYYLRLDVRFGLLMTALMSGAIVVGHVIAAQSTLIWVAAALTLFVGGWIIQFIGHIYEGKKPAFVDDLMGLLIGPLFVAAEVVFALGLRKELFAEITERAGPTIIRGSTTTASVSG